MHWRCLNARVTNLDFAFLIQPSSLEFQLNSHFASIILPIDCYAGPNVWACSRPLNFLAVEPRNISACSNAFALEIVDGVARSLAGAVERYAPGFGNACSLNALSNASRVANSRANAAWDIRPILWCEPLIARFSPCLRPSIRTSDSSPSSRTMRSGTDAGGYGSGAGAATADAGTGAAVAGAAARVAVAVDVGWMYT